MAKSPSKQVAEKPCQAPKMHCVALATGDSEFCVVHERNPNYVSSSASRKRP